jgi:hypothetical protein
MATVTEKRLCKGTLSDSNATLYTAPSGTGDYTVIIGVTLCNTTASGATVTIKFAGTDVICGYTLLAYDTITVEFISQILQESELIEGSSGTASAINYYISGKEVVA